MPQSVLLQDLTKSFGWNERDAFQQHDVQARNCDNATVNSIDYRPLIHEGISSLSTMRCRNALSRQHSMRSFVQELCYVLFEALETQFAHTSLKGFVAKW